MRPLALLIFAACAGLTAPTQPPRIVLFGDSNTEGGWNAQNVEVEWGYISAERPLTPSDAPNGSHQLAGKLDGHFSLVVNHGMSGRTTTDALSHFDAEVLGLGGKTWDGGTGIPRMQSFVPTQADYVYVSLGTNDWAHLIPADSTIRNLEWMVNRWLSSGLPSKHFIITTLAPRTGEYGHEIPALNPKIRGLALKYHLSLIDLSQYVSPDDGLTWRAESFNVGDGTHYSGFVRDWIARSILDLIKYP